MKYSNYKNNREKFKYYLGKKEGFKIRLKINCKILIFII